MIVSVKARARNLLSGRYALLIGASLFVEIVTLLISDLLFSGGSGSSAIIFSVVSSCAITLLAGILDGGLHRLYLKAANGEKGSLMDLFYYFRNGPDHFILVALFLLIIDVILTLPFGILLPKQVSFWIMPFPIYADGLLSGVSIMVRVFLSLIWAAVAIVVRVPFLFAYYIAVDQENASLPDVVKTCISISSGKVLQLAALLLSFIGLLLLGLLTLGIGYLWIIPYIRMSITVFYRSLTE